MFDDNSNQADFTTTKQSAIEKKRTKYQNAHDLLAHAELTLVLALQEVQHHSLAHCGELGSIITRIERLKEKFKRKT